MFSWDTLDTIILTAQSLIADRYLNIVVDQMQPFMSIQRARNQMKTIESMLQILDLSMLMALNQYHFYTHN